MPFVWLFVCVQAPFWEAGEEVLSVKERMRQQDSVLGVERWAGHLVVSSTIVTLNSLENLGQRRTVADDTREDESLTVSYILSLYIAPSYSMFFDVGHTYVCTLVKSV